MPLVVAVMVEPPRSAKEESRPSEMTQDLTLVFGQMIPVSLEEPMALSLNLVWGSGWRCLTSLPMAPHVFELFLSRSPTSRHCS